MIKGGEEFIRVREKDKFWKALTPSLLPRAKCPSELLNPRFRGARVTYSNLLALAACTHSDRGTYPGAPEKNHS